MLGNDETEVREKPCMDKTKQATYFIKESLKHQVI